MKLMITGASGGIGLYLANELSKTHDVWGVARSPRNQNFGFRFTPFDLTEPDQVFKLSEDVEKHWSELDGLVCCAGIQGTISPFSEVNPIDWLHAVHLNLASMVLPINILLPLIVKSKKGKIICFSGGGATSPRPNFSAYACAKIGIVRLVEILAKEFQELSIIINAIAPGPIYTGMTDEILSHDPDVVGVDEYENAKLLSKTKNNNLLKVLNLVRFLLSSDSNGISGRLISALWDDWESWPENLDELKKSDVYTLRRVTGRDRGFPWGDK